VIITVMAFNLRPPAHDNWTSVDHRLPNLLIYNLSFTVIGIHWNNHRLLRTPTTISGDVLWTNLALLFWLSLVPVVTEWTGQDGRSSFLAVKCRHRLTGERPHVLRRGAHPRAR
jgi:uncharacterized membrane protein